MSLAIGSVLASEACLSPLLRKITTPKDHASDKRDVENLNPQVKRKTPPNSAKSGRKDNKPGVLSSKLPDQTSGGKKPTTRSSVSHGSGSGSAEKPSSSAKEVARISTTGKENTQHKGPAKPADAADSPVRPSKRPRGWKEDSETGGKQGEAMNKQKSTLQKRRSGSANASPDEPPPRTRHGSSSGRAPSKDVPAAAEPREEDDDDVIIVEAKEGKKDTAEKKKSGSCKGKQTEAGHTQRKTQGRKLACRGRDAGLVIEDMDETVIKAAEASLEKGTMKIVPAPPSGWFSRPTLSSSRSTGDHITPLSPLALMFTSCIS